MRRLSIKPIFLVESKIGITLRSQNEADIGMAITWLRANGMLRTAGNHHITDSGRHSMRVMIDGNRREAIKLVKDRFGSFIDVD